MIETIGSHVIGNRYILNREKAEEYLRLGLAIRIREAAARIPTKKTAANRGASKR
tara:strand:+ start:19 stop:183 length:165 start_codon:yes stop_codon:yes gene_type:complete